VQILFYNLIVLVNLSILLKQPIVFIGALSGAVVLHYLNNHHQKKVETNLEELTKLRNDINALKTQMAFKKL
jgi:hypothetical protein